MFGMTLGKIMTENERQKAEMVTKLDEIDDLFERKEAGDQTGRLERDSSMRATERRLLAILLTDAEARRNLPAEVLTLSMGAHTLLFQAIHKNRFCNTEITLLTTVYESSDVNADYIADLYRWGKQNEDLHYYFASDYLIVLAKSRKRAAGSVDGKAD